MPPPRKRRIREEPADISRLAQTSRPAPTSCPDQPAESTVPVKKGPKKTWPKPESEKAKITDQLLPYKSIPRCELCDIEFNHTIMAKAHLTGKPHHKKLKVLGLPVPEICVDKKFPSTAKYQLEIECSASVESKMLTFVVFVVKKHSMFVKTVIAQHHNLTITRSVISEF